MVRTCNNLLGYLLWIFHLVCLTRSVTQILITRLDVSFMLLYNFVEASNFEKKSRWITNSKCEWCCFEQKTSCEHWNNWTCRPRKDYINCRNYKGFVIDISACFSYAFLCYILSSKLIVTNFLCCVNCNGSSALMNELTVVWLPPQLGQNLKYLCYLP